MGHHALCQWLQGFVRIHNICLISEGIKLQPHTWISSSPPSLPVTPHTSKSTHTPLSISFPIIICSSPSLPILPPYPLRCSMGCRITHSRKNNYLIFGKWNFLRTNLTDRTMLTLENIGKLFRIVRENIWFSADPSCNSIRFLQQFETQHSLSEGLLRCRLLGCSLIFMWRRHSVHTKRSGFVWRFEYVPQTF